MKVKEIFTFLDNKFSFKTAQEFDNVGILVGSENDEVKNVLIALDCTLQTIKKAIDNNCNLIITHHPVIFNPLKDVLENSVTYELIKNNITVISSHTNLDIAKNGVNDCLCRALELKNIKPFTAFDGLIIRSATVSPISADEFAEHIKSKLGGSVKYYDSAKKIKKVLVCSGSGGDYLYDAINNGFDAFISGDIKHHQFIDAINHNISIFDAGHFNTEDIVIEPLKNLLATNFKDIKFICDHLFEIKYK